MKPALVRCSVPTTRAMPKSMIFTVPDSVTMMFAGLRSRWTTPRLCACASAASACMQSSAASVRRAALARDERLERLAAHELHDHQPLAVVLEQLVDRGDAGMIEARDGDRLGAETPGDRGIVQLGVEDLDRDFAMKRLVDRAVHRAHAATADAIRVPGTCRCSARPFV